MTVESALTAYCNELVRQFATGHAKEHAYRPALKILLESFEDITAINDPKRSAHGNPDFVFVQTSNVAITRGYAEAKDIDVNLDKEEHSEQMARYRGYANLFLTNYLEFRFLRNGEKYKSIVIGELVGGNIVFRSEQIEALQRELKAFVSLPPEKITSGGRLAMMMGAKARRLRDDIVEFVGDGDEDLARVMSMLKDRLVPDLSPAGFADMYAQTLVYGLFVARFADDTPATFSRQEARDLVPKTNPFLRAFFDHIVGPEFDKRLGYIVDELCELFRVSDVEGIVTKHLKISEITRAEKDPIIHFYEDFLSEYDKDVRKAMGAYYTPVPVARYIVERVDEVLRSHFAITAGLASTETISYSPKVSTHLLTAAAKEAQAEASKQIQLPRVQILDPATGTGTFLNETVKFLRSGFVGKEGRWPKYVSESLMQRMHGFELMMAPYTVAHLKLGLTLSETGARSSDSRLNIFLTNTLEEGAQASPGLFEFGLSEAVTEESQLASEVKQNKPIMIVLGNPPYSAASSNRTKYANSLVDKYKVEPGGRVKLDEKKNWLNDDYVKFLAFAEDMIAANGSGIVAMITNNGYFDNPTFRGMRWHLARTFDDIYVLDLHGNLNKKEKSPDGSKDENVFPIRQGVGIIVAIKTTSSDDLARVHHGELFGKRSEKFRAMAENEIDWSPIDLSADKKFLYFVPRSVEGQSEWEAGIPVDRLFRRGSTGILTSGDPFIVSRSSSEIAERVQKLVHGGFTADQLTNGFGLGKGYAKFVLPKASELDYDESRVVRFGYRPFDTRYTYYDNKVLWRWRAEVMDNFLESRTGHEPNVGLVTTRLQKQNPGGFITETMVGHKVFNSYDSNTVFPLYVFDDEGGRVSNLDDQVLAEFLSALSPGVEHAPEDVLDYIYAVLHLPSYRSRFAEFMKSEFPRIPRPSGDREFVSRSKFGSELRLLHLGRTDVDDTVTFPVSGSDVVEKVSFQDNCVWINDTQYFGNISDAAWDFHVGGYRPAHQWLADRVGESLSDADFTTYMRIPPVLDETIRLITQLDVSEQGRG